MVNVNIDGPIPLAGAGFHARRNGDFQPGEFKRLSNVELYEESLVNRRPVKSVAGSSTGATITPMVNCLGFMGHFSRWTILASSTEQIAVGPGEKYTMWAPTQLTVPAEAGSFHRIIGFFRYVKRNYWITLEYRAGIHIKIKLYHGNASTNNDVPETYNNAYFATLTETTIYTLLPADVSFNDFKFNNFIIQGNRLWLFTSLGVYFSKATDPTIFAVPDGGFFKFPDQIINHGCALKDAIYVLCDNSIHTINYSTDPNVDSFVTQIADNVGGEDSAVHRDAVYVINQVGIYRILNGSVDKVIDNEFDVGLDYYKNTITSFEDYLVVNKYSPINYEKFTASNALTRTNLFPNPSVETNLTGFIGSDAFMLRPRTDLNPAVGGFGPYAGSDYVIKCQKINDTTQVRYTNLYKNPSFEVDTSFHNPGSQSTILRANVSTLGGGAPNGTYALESIVDVVKNTSNPTAYVDRLAAESDYYPVVLYENVNFNWSHWIEEEIDDNDGYMVLRIYAYDAAQVLIPGVDPLTGTPHDWQYETLLFDQVNVWHRQHAKFVVSDLIVHAMENVASIKFKWVLKTKRLITQSVQFFADKISMFKVDNATFDAITGPDYIPYFDGNTADVANVAVYDWTGTVGKSSSTQKGTIGDSNQQRLLTSYSANNIIVSPDKTYKLGVAVGSPQSNRDFELYVRQYSAADALLVTSVLTLGSTVNVGAYSYLTAQITTSSSTDHIEIDYRTKDAMNALDFVYLDAFIVELSNTYQGYFDGSFVDSAAVDYSWSGTAHASTSTALISNLLRALYLQGKFFNQGQQFNTLGYNTYFLNMDNGSIHVMDFRDALDLPEDSRGRVADVYVNPNKDSSGNYNMFLYTARKTAEADSSYTFTNKFYYMSSFRDINFTDWAVTSGDVLQKYPPKVEIEVDSFVPDGSEYLTKKFRHLLMMAKIPTTDFKVKFAFDDSPYGAEKILNSVAPAGRPHYPYRIAVNQRAKSLTIFFFNSAYNVPLSVEVDYDVLEISDLRTLWTYTARAIDKSRR